MKKYLIPAVVLLAVFIGIVVFFVSLSFSKIQYQKDMSSHMQHIEEGGTLITEYQGQKTEVIGRNLGTISGALTRTTRKKLFFVPSYNPENAVFLEFSDGARYMIVVNEKVEDGVYIHYEYRNKKQWISIEKLDTFEWITRAISPEGIYNENIIVE